MLEGLIVRPMSRRRNPQMWGWGLDNHYILWSDGAMWADEAACADPMFDTNAWFPAGARGRVAAGEVRPDPYAFARSVCATCPVKRACLAEAMKVEGSAPHGRFGMYGGLRPAERDALYRRERRVRKVA